MKDATVEYRRAVKSQGLPASVHVLGLILSHVSQVDLQISQYFWKIIFID